MALRSPLYLDLTTLAALAEYHEIDVPRKAEVIEKQRRQRAAGGRASIGPVGGNAALGNDIEYQASYTLEPSEKASVSRIIDGLISDEVVIGVTPFQESALSKDCLIELDGRTRITAASLAGKMFYIFRRLMAQTDRDLTALTDFDVEDPDVAQQLRQVYLANELLPIPLLLEMSGTSLPQKVYINVRPDHFVDAASVNRVEGEVRVLGSITQLVGGGDEGYLSAEQWLLPDYEYMLRRLLMTEIGDVVEGMVSELGIDLPAHDVHAYISGPAVVVDAVAIY